MTTPEQVLAIAASAKERLFLECSEMFWAEAPDCPACKSQMTMRTANNRNEGDRLQ